jgi:hypothetical protein
MHLIKTTPLFICVYVGAFQAAHGDTGVIRTIESNDYHNALKLFDEVGYTAEKWQAGIREVPRIEITDIPQRRQNAAQTIPVSDRKNIFFLLTGSVTPIMTRPPRYNTNR